MKKYKKMKKILLPTVCAMIMCLSAGVFIHVYNSNASNVFNDNVEALCDDESSGQKLYQNFVREGGLWGGLVLGCDNVNSHTDCPKNQ